MSWIFFPEIGKSPSGKTKIWDVQTKDGYSLGQVRWFAKWRKYSFYPVMGTIFDAECLRDIATFCGSQTRNHKA